MHFLYVRLNKKKGGTLNSRTFLVLVTLLRADLPRIAYRSLFIKENLRNYIFSGKINNSKEGKIDSFFKIT